MKRPFSFISLSKTSMLIWLNPNLFLVITSAYSFKISSLNNGIIMLAETYYMILPGMESLLSIDETMTFVSMTA